MSDQDDQVQDESGDTRSTEVERAEFLRQLELNREQPKVLLATWAIRVAIMAVVLWLLNHFMGPFPWIWKLLALYAVLSLILSFVMARIKNKQLDRLKHLGED